MKDLNIRPNFSDLSREYGVDRHTIKKYFDNDGIPERKPKKSVSMWDPYLDEITTMMETPGITKKAIYM